MSGGYYKYRCKYWLTFNCQNWVWVKDAPCAHCLAHGRDCNQPPTAHYGNEVVANGLSAATESALMMQCEGQPDMLPTYLFGTFDLSGGGSTVGLLSPSTDMARMRWEVIRSAQMNFLVGIY